MFVKLAGKSLSSGSREFTLLSQFLGTITAGHPMLHPPRFPVRKASSQIDWRALAAWSLFVVVLLLWLFLRRAADPTQPVDGLLLLALTIQVWLICHTREGGR
jgi:hypothetical protein